MRKLNEQPEQRDIGDLVDPDADDPTPDEITDREHPDYVEPWSPT